MAITIYTGTRRMVKPVSNYNILRVEVLPIGGYTPVFIDDRTKFKSPFYDYTTLINKFISPAPLNGSFLASDSQNADLTSLKKDISLKYFVQRESSEFSTRIDTTLLYDQRRYPEPFIDNTVISRSLVDYIAPLSNCIVCTTYNSSGLQVTVDEDTEDLDEFNASFNQSFDASISSTTVLSTTPNQSNNNYIPVSPGSTVEIGSWKKRILDDCTYSAQLIYYNQMGGFEMLPLKGNGVQQLEPTTDVRHYQQVSQSNFRNNVQSYNFNLPNTNTVLIETVQYTLPFISVDRTPYLEDLIKSPVCWLQVGKNKVYQVVIDSLNEINHNTFQARYAITMKYSINTILR